jgi:4-aminobutyrate aminotransferase-like enzyme
MTRNTSATIGSGAMPNAFDPSQGLELPHRLRGLVERRRSLLGPGYKLFYERPIEFVRASGVRLYDVDGQEYLDAYNNVPCVGHCHPKVTAAISRQVAELNTNTRYLAEPLLDYAERLLSTHHPGLTNVMFACSGSEAVDLALRIARYTTGAEGVIVTSNAYHGVTGAVARVSPSLGNRVPLGPEVRTVEPPSSDPSVTDAGEQFAQRVEAAMVDLRRHGIATAAVLVDSLFCSDGLIPDPVGFLAPVEHAARGAGALFVCDEVQAGFGRTGTSMWGYQRHGVEPDLVTMGKPMGNGFPISGVAARGVLLERFGEDVRYFNTFGANSVAIAAATAVLDVLEEDGLLANARVVGDELRASIAAVAATHPVLRGVRGAGLYVAADVVAPATGVPDAAAASQIVNGMRGRHVLISSAGRHGTALKVRPPLPFNATDAAQLVEALDDVLREMAD